MHPLPVTFVIPVVQSLPPDLRTDFLGRYGLTPPDLYDVDRQVDWSLFDALVDQSRRLTGDRSIGLVQGGLVDLRQLGLVAWILMNSGTVGRALDQFHRYNAIVCSGIGYEVEADPRSVVVRFVGTIPGRVLGRTLMDSVLKSFQKLLEQLTLDPLPLREVSVQHADEGDSEDYRRSLGVVPRYDRPHYAMTYDRDLLDRPIRFSDPGLLAQFQAQADRRLAAYPGTATATRLQRYLASRLDGRPVRIAEAARHLALGVRTLQAHLKAEGTTYQQTVESVHRAYAEAELTRRDLPVGEVAWILGYSEQSAFQTAFKRWTGMTPLQYRHRKPQGPG